MDYQELKNRLPNLKDNGVFSFGFNWESYVQMIMNENIIDIHYQDLYKLYQNHDIDLNGKDVIDIGSGSGLSSLCLERLGVKNLISIDIDIHSVNATKLAKEKFGLGKSNWNIFQKSVLDGLDGQYDLVYTWGVLHHTGNMFQAIRIASNVVKVGGFLHIALYNDGPNYLNDLKQKQKFASLNRNDKIQMLSDYLGNNTGDWFSVDNRGMTQFHDALDWLGGMPYEVCSPQTLFGMLSNFEMKYLHPGGERGNFIAIMQRKI